MKKLFTILAAILVAGSMWGATYTKVTSAPADWSGEYLVVYESSETSGLSWVGTDAAENTVSQTISNGSITAENAVTITVAKLTEGYSVKVNGGANDGKYISSGSTQPAYTNALKFIENAHRVDFALNTNGFVTITQTIEKSGTMYLLYNSSSSIQNGAETNKRYRFYKGTNYKDDNSGNYKVPVLYKIVNESGPVNLATPTNLAEDNILATSATLTWDAVANVNSYTVKIGSTEYTGITTNSYSATGLSSNTQYTWTVKAIGDGVNYTSSDYATANSFTTTKVLNRISISGTLSKTTYKQGETLDPAGLTVSADYGEIEPTVVTSSVVWSVFDEELNEVSSFVTLGTNNYYIQASFGGKSDVTDLIAIEVVELSRKAFVLAYDGVYYAATTSLSSSKLAKKEVKVVNGMVYVPTEADKNAIAWTISETDTEGEYTIAPATGDNSTKYLSAAAGSANLSFATTVCNWKRKNDDGKISYWISKTDGTDDYYRTITYQAGQTNAFKAYTNSLIGTTGYASTAAYEMEIVVGDVVTVTTAQYATYYNADRAFVMPEGLEGIVVDDIEDNTLDLMTYYVAGSVVPAGEPLILHATSTLAEATLFTLVYGTTTKASLKSTGDNLLSGTSTATDWTTGGDKYYRLTTGDNNQVGFYWGAEKGAAFKPGANKAYLAISNTSAPARFVFGAPQTPTDIESVSAETTVQKVMINGQVFILRGEKLFDTVGRQVK